MKKKCFSNTFIYIILNIIESYSEYITILFSSELKYLYTKNQIHTLYVQEVVLNFYIIHTIRKRTRLFGYTVSYAPNYLISMCKRRKKNLIASLQFNMLQQIVKEKTQILTNQLLNNLFLSSTRRESVKKIYII